MTNYTQEVNESTKINIVFCLNNSYAMPLAATLKSVTVNLNKSVGVNVFIIGNISKSNRMLIQSSFIKDNVDIKWVTSSGEIEKLIKCLPVRAHFSKDAYYKLFIPELLPRTVSKVIFLDPDIIALCDLKEFWEIDFEEAYLVAINSEKRKIRHLFGRSVPPDEQQPEFNTGVMLIDLKKWRDDDVKGRILDFIRNKKYMKHIYNVDQDILNQVLVGKWKAADDAWNVSIRFAELKSNPKIIHFITGGKPWNVAGEKRPLADIFYKYLDMTAWKGWRLTFFRKLQQTVYWKYKKFRKAINKWK